MRVFLLCCLVFALLLCLGAGDVSAQTPTATPTNTITPTPTLGAPDCQVYVLFEFIGPFAGGLDPTLRAIFEDTVSRMGYTNSDQPSKNIGFRWNLVGNAVIADGQWYYRPDYQGLVAPFQRQFGFDEALMRTIVTMQVLGRGGCVRQDSLLAALEYLSDNRAQWEANIP